MNYPKVWDSSGIILNQKSTLAVFRLWWMIAVELSNTTSDGLEASVFRLECCKFTYITKICVSKTMTINGNYILQHTGNITHIGNAEEISPFRSKTDILHPDLRRRGRDWSLCSLLLSVKRVGFQWLKMPWLLLILIFVLKGVL